MKIKFSFIKGFGLLDVLLAVAVSAVVIVLGLSYYSTTRTTQKVNQTMQQIGQIITGVQSLLQQTSAQSSSSFNPLTAGNLTPKLLSSNLVEPSTVTSVWDSSSMTVTLTSGSAVNKLNRGSTMVCLRVNIKICGMSTGAINKLTNRYMSSFSANYPARSLSGKCMVFSSCIQ